MQVVAYTVTFSTSDYSNSSALQAYINAQFGTSFFALFPATFTTVRGNGKTGRGLPLVSSRVRDLGVSSLSHPNMLIRPVPVQHETAVHAWTCNVCCPNLISF